MTGIEVLIIVLIVGVIVEIGLIISKFYKKYQKNKK